MGELAGSLRLGDLAVGTSLWELVGPAGGRVQLLVESLEREAG